MSGPQTFTLLPTTFPPLVLIMIWLLIQRTWRVLRVHGLKAILLPFAILAVVALTIHDALWANGILVNTSTVLMSNFAILLVLLALHLEQYDIDLFERVEWLSGNLKNEVAIRTRQLGQSLEEVTRKEQEIGVAYRKAEQANQAKSRFLAAASHDLRQPLHAMGLLFEQLKGQSLDSSGRLALASIEQLHRTLSETLSLLLDISRLDAGGVSPKSVCFPLQELFTSLVRTYQINAAEVGMEIRVHPTSAIVRSDPAMLNHILSNLVDNAIRHGRPPGLLLGVRRCGEQWSLEVWDTGVGIPPEQQREIFREFVQLDNPGHDSSKGYGLGLSIVDRLARLLSHPLRIASRVGRGTCIKLLVPDGASEFEPPRSFHQALNHSSQNSLQGCLVLLLEDDLAVREITTELLRRWGCGVATASSAEQAMAVTREEEIDLILADYRLNGPLTGADIIARLDQATGRKHPAIILSGDMDGLHEQQEKLDRTHITLPKPISPMALRSALQRALSTRSP